VFDPLQLLLATPLAELRDRWLQVDCACGTTRTPMWFHAAQHPDWLMSDLALDFSCSNCWEAPGMTLLGQNRLGQPLTAEQIRIVERFVEE
jgi:hypothetical protein